MRYALILMALGLATTAAARPAPSNATETASGAAVRSSCTLSRMGADAGDTVALDCVIRDERPVRRARSDPATVQMVSARTTAGLDVVSGVPRAARNARSDLSLRAVIGPPATSAGAANEGEVVLDARTAAAPDRIEVVGSRP